MNIINNIIKGFNSILNFITTNRKIIIFFLELLSPLIIFIIIIVLICILYKLIIIFNSFYQKNLKHRIENISKKFFRYNEKNISNVNEFMQNNEKIINKIKNIINKSCNNVSILIFSAFSILYSIGADKQSLNQTLGDALIIFIVSQIIAVPYTVYKIKKSAPENTGTDKS